MSERNHAVCVSHPIYHADVSYLNIHFFFFLMSRRPPSSPLFPYPTLFRSLPPYPIFLITDTATDIGGLPAGIEVVRHDSQVAGKARKAEFFLCLPEQIETALLLDADTRVIGDVSLGFEKAEKHGIAMVPAPHYSLADFRDFRQVMLKEGVTPLGQIIYNSGVIFCAPRRPDRSEEHTSELQSQ